jgi:endonuclease G
LRGYNASVQNNDPKLAEEIRDSGPQQEVFTEAAPVEETERQIALETIVMRRMRPVLAIRDNVTLLAFTDQADSEIWRARLEKARPLLNHAIPAVGRIDLIGGHLDWVGTGWLVADDVLVTNRHVAREFAIRDGGGFTFTMGPSARISATIDFLGSGSDPLPFPAGN